MPDAIRARCQNTLTAWRKEHPELESQMEIAREQARQKALEGIKTPGEKGDWRASEAFLRMSFPADYRTCSSINLSATAGIDNKQVVITEEKRKELQQKLRRIQELSGKNL